MAKSKKSSKKPTVKVQDLEPEADPKGGAVDVFLKLGANKAFGKVEMALHKGSTTGIKLDGSLSTIGTLTDKYHK